MNLQFAEAIGLLRDNDLTQFEKLIKQFPQILEIRRHGRSLLTYALLYDRVRILQLISKKSPHFCDMDENSESILHWAVQADARKCCKYLLGLQPRQSCDISYWITLKNRRHITPLHLAARYGRVKILKMLLQFSAINSENFYEMVNDDRGQSPLHYAAGTAKLECCELLLDDRLGLPVDQKDHKGHTPLMCAAASCYPEASKLVRLLGNRKISSITARDNEGRTALHLAVLAENGDVIDVLLNELNCPPETFDNDARTPLHYAAQRGLRELIQKLLAAKARNATRDCFGVSPAHYAAQNGHCEVMDRLLASSGGMEQYDSDGRSCFMWAVIADHISTVNHFLEHYHPERAHKDKFGYTALHHAAHIGSLRMVKLLIKEGWNIHETENTGATALHLAAAKGFTDVVRLLVMVGANCEHIDRQGRTAVFYACLGGQSHTLNVMVTELNCKATHSDKLSRTALHCAAFGGYTACIEVLLEQTDCPIHTGDLDQWTALHVACERGKFDCVKYLVQSGAAVNALAHTDDCTPLSCAQANGHQQIADYLLRNGGLFPHQLRNLAAMIIQKWWQSLQQKRLSNVKKYSENNTSNRAVIRKPRILQ